jgi:hypothetical protein
MIKFSTLVRNTPRNIIDNTKTVRTMRLVQAWSSVDEKGRMFKGVMVHSRASSVVRLVQFRLYASQKGVPIFDHNAWIHCSCEYWLFYLEVALSTKGSSSIINSNGEYPAIRNPHLQPHVCKHVYAAVPLIARIKAWPYIPRKKP